MYYEGMMPTFSGALVVTSHSSSLEDTMSVHAGAEGNVCIIKVSAEIPQSTTNPSQTLLPMYTLAHLSLSHPQDSHNL